MTGKTVVTDGLCYMCTHSCPTKIHVKDGKAVQIDIADPRAAHCPRWKAQLELVYHPDRLMYPQVRKGPRGSGDWERISWDEALDTVADNLQKVKNEYGPESVAFWIAYTKEPRPYFHRLVHGFGSPNYCTESSNCFSATWIVSNLTFGPEYSYMAGTSAAADPATQCKLVWGAAVVSAGRVWEDNLAAIERDVPYIVVDPRRTHIASKATLHLQPRPGTDGALALGMLRVIINEGLYDKEFVEKWTSGFDGLKELVQEYTPGHTEKITGVPANKIIEAARLFATTKPARLHLSGNSTTHHSNGVQNHRAVLMLAAITGNLDIKGGNRLPEVIFTGKANDITLHERVTNMPPGIGSQRFPVWTERYREMQSNCIVDQIESSQPYPIKALFSPGLNVQFFANSQRMERVMKQLEFIAVTEYFHTPGTQLADIVLPIASWIERPILLSEGRARLIQPAIEPLGECRTEWEIYSGLAKRLGIGDLFWDGDFSRCVDHILEPLKITYTDLLEHPEGIELPSEPRPEKSYEARGFSTPSGKVEIASSVLAKHGLDALPVYHEPAESPLSRPDLAGEYPLVMTSGARVMAYTHSQYRNLPTLRKMMKDPLVDIHPDDAKARGIKNGDRVSITTPRDTIYMKANVTDAILRGVVSMPHHWPGDANANALVNDKTLDPVSGFIPCKSQLCEVKRV